MQPQFLHDELGVVHVRCWYDVVRLREGAQIDTLVIDPSANPVVQKRWLKEEYEQGLRIVAFNIGSSELAGLLEERRFKEHGLDPSASDPFFVAVNRSPLICKPQLGQPLRRATGTSQGRSQEFLITDQHWDFLQHVLGRKALPPERC